MRTILNERKRHFASLNQQPGRPVGAAGGAGGVPLGEGRGLVPGGGPRRAATAHSDPDSCPILGVFAGTGATGWL